MSSIADHTGEQYGFRLVPVSEYTSRRLHEARWELERYQFEGMRPDFYWHIADTLGWVSTQNGSLLNVPFDKPTIAAPDLPAARNVFVAWKELFSLAPDLIRISGSDSLEGTTIRNRSVVFRRDEVLLALKRLISLIDQAGEPPACLVWDIRYDP
jgi:hypothetical protein